MLTDDGGCIMANKNNSKVISEAKPHTIKKFELIEEYVKSWAHKLMLNDSCNGLVFIDCMCNNRQLLYGRIYVQ